MWSKWRVNPLLVGDVGNNCDYYINYCYNNPLQVYHASLDEGSLFRIEIELKQGVKDIIILVLFPYLFKHT